MKIRSMEQAEREASSLQVEDIIELEKAAGVTFGPFHKKWMLERAPEKVRKLLEKAAERPELVAGQQTFTSADQQLFPPASLRAAISATTTEGNLWDPSMWGIIPAFDMKAGKGYQVEFGGVMGTTATPTIVFRGRCGTNNSTPPTGTDLGIGPTVTLGTFTAQPFYGEFQMGVRSVGVAASGATVTGNGFVAMPAAAAATATPHAVMGGAIPTTVDHTVAQGLSVTAAWGTANASNTITPQWMFSRSMD